MTSAAVFERFGVQLRERSRVQLTWSGGNGPHWYHVIESYGELYLLTDWEKNVAGYRHHRRGFVDVAEVHDSEP